MRRGVFEVGMVGVDDAFQATRGRNTEVARRAIDSIVAKLNLACVGTTKKPVDAVAELQLPGPLKDIVRHHVEISLNQDWPTLGKL